MLRRVLVFLLPALILGTSVSQGEWRMRIHKEAGVEEHAIADIDSITFYETHPVPMVLVPAGVFIMGDEVAACANQHQVTLTHDFYLGQHEVTNQEYRDAVQWAYDHGYVTVTSFAVNDNLDGSTVLLVNIREASYAHCQISFNEGTFTVDSGKEDHPMIEVSWYGAAAYCDWLSMQEPGLMRAYDHSTWECNGGDPYGASGYRLPTDAEWEYAAQYDDERVYPWGNESPNCDRANYYGCLGGEDPLTSEVGSYPAAPAALGLYDMAGNVEEWCNDWYTCNLGNDPVTNPIGFYSGVPCRVLRGGTWAFDESLLRCAQRRSKNLSICDFSTGFRCARSR